MFPSARGVDSPVVYYGSEDEGHGVSNIASSSAEHDWSPDETLNANSMQNAPVGEHNGNIGNTNTAVANSSMVSRSVNEGEGPIP